MMEIAEAHLHAVEMGAEVVGVHALEAAGLGTAAAIAGPVASLALGMYKLAEAKHVAVSSITRSPATSNASRC